MFVFCERNPFQVSSFSNSTCFLVSSRSCSFLSNSFGHTPYLSSLTTISGLWGNPLVLRPYILSSPREEHSLMTFEKWIMPNLKWLEKKGNHHLVLLHFTFAFRRNIYTIKAEYFLWICPWIFLLITKHSISFFNCFKYFSKMKSPTNLLLTFSFLSPLSRFKSHFVLRDLRNQIK